MGPRSPVAVAEYVTALCYMVGWVRGRPGLVALNIAACQVEVGAQIGLKRRFLWNTSLISKRFLADIANFADIAKFAVARERQLCGAGRGPYAGSGSGPAPCNSALSSVPVRSDRSVRARATRSKWL